MNLVFEQNKFRQDIAKLELMMDELGIISTYGEAYRPPEQAWINALPPRSNLVATVNKEDIVVYHSTYPDKVGGRGIAHSIHEKRCAMDYNFFFLDYQPMNAKTPELIVLGQYWESLDAKNRWGGNFTPTKNRPLGDIYHFERNV